jgi:hypothetical protein
MTVIAGIAKVTSPALEINARPFGVRHALQRTHHSEALYSLI